MLQTHRFSLIMSMDEFGVIGEWDPMVIQHGRNVKSNHQKIIKPLNSKVLGNSPHQLLYVDLRE
jgi:hypothetical protein